MSSSNSEIIINTAAFNLCDELTRTLMKHILQLQEAEQWFERSTQRLNTARKEYEKAQIEAEEADEEAEKKSERDDVSASDDEDFDEDSKDKEEYTASEICMMKSFALEDAKKLFKQARDDLDAAKKQVRATQKALAAAQKKAE